MVDNLIPGFGQVLYIKDAQGNLAIVGPENPLPMSGGSGGGGGAVTVDNITDATAVGKSVLKSADAAAVRTAIGAGTSNLKVGTTAADAKAGNYAPAVADISGATALGKQLMAVADAAAARTAIGAGTPVSAATTAANGTVKQAAAQANSAATDVAGLVADFNSLLGKLRTAGILAP
ncbi:Head fiber protein [compost metagenome]